MIRVDRNPYARPRVCPITALDEECAMLGADLRFGEVAEPTISAYLFFEAGSLGYRLVKRFWPGNRPGRIGAF